MPTDLTVAQAILCLASTVNGGAVDVNVIFNPAVGTTAFFANSVSDGSLVIPEGWGTFTLSNRTTSTSNLTVGGGEIPPGLSIGHGTWDGFPGEEITVTVPIDAAADATWTIPTPTP